MDQVRTLHTVSSSHFFIYFFAYSHLFCLRLRFNLCSTRFFKFYMRLFPSPFYYSLVLFPILLQIFHFLLLLKGPSFYYPKSSFWTSLFFYSFLFFPFFFLLPFIFPSYAFSLSSILFSFRAASATSDIVKDLTKPITDEESLVHDLNKQNQSFFLSPFFASLIWLSYFASLIYFIYLLSF